MELQEAILKRRSVRKFTDYYVTDDEIKTLMEAAQMAPSWSNTQSWEFIIVRDKEIIEKITETYSETNPARKCSLASTALIIGIAKMGLAGCKKGEESTKFNGWFLFDMGCAIQNISLKAHEIGLGSVIVGLFDHDKCKEILSAPENYEVVVTLPVGKPLIPDKAAPGRKELKDFVHFNTFGENFIK
ncbi:MAG: nitroreductase family protein [Bacteroidetes bacterium]|nr:nitroreductase family protein [Bacteroidota bacterium]